MFAATCTSFSRTSGISGLLISLAIVFAGNAAIAEGVTGFSGSGRLPADLFGNFSASDLDRLEHATDTEASAARLAALGVKTSPIATSSRKSAVDAVLAARIDDADLFPHSARLLPLIVARPAAETFAGRNAISPRPGIAQPVGVPRASLRPRLPVASTAR